MVGESAYIEIEGFVWDFEPEGNVEHLARHDVTIADVEAVLDAGALFFRNLGEHAATYAMVGRDGRKRSLIVYLLSTPERGIWKPVTGWQSRLAHAILEREGRV